MTLDEVEPWLRYEPETGRLIWIAGKRNGVSFSDARVGTQAGSVNGEGYLTVRVAGATRQAHRVAWVLMTGSECPGPIDHKNGARTDNRWLNLRASSNRENGQNRRTVERSTASGLLGVSRGGTRAARPWRSKIVIDGKATHLGMFDSPQEAHEAYLAAKRLLHPACTI